MTAAQELNKIVRRKLVSPLHRQQHCAMIADQLLMSSASMQRPNFTAISDNDLQTLFELYDDTFFGGRVHKTLAGCPLAFRISKRMTSAGGKTSRWGDPRQTRKLRYEIAVSSTLLFQSFKSPGRKITVTGYECESRLDALMRVMEHEVVHLIEMLLWNDSNCSLSRFQDITSRQFGHTQHTHNLLSPRENAAVEFGIKSGCRVRFEFEGRRLEGIVNRVTKRATILVADSAGRRYSDGNHYSKYYIPVPCLEVIE